MSVRAAVYEFVDKFYMHCLAYPARTSSFKNLVESLVSNQIQNDKQLKKWLQTCIVDYSENPRFHRLWFGGYDCIRPDELGGEQNEEVCNCIKNYQKSLQTAIDIEEEKDRLFDKMHEQEKRLSIITKSMEELDNAQQQVNLNQRTVKIVKRSRDCEFESYQKLRQSFENEKNHQDQNNSESGYLSHDCINQIISDIQHKISSEMNYYTKEQIFNFTKQELNSENATAIVKISIQKTIEFITNEMLTNVEPRVNCAIKKNQKNKLIDSERLLQYSENVLQTCEDVIKLATDNLTESEQQLIIIAEKHKNLIKDASTHDQDNSDGNNVIDKDYVHSSQNPTAVLDVFKACTFKQ